MQRCVRLCLLDFFQQDCNCTHASYIDDDSFKNKYSICAIETNGSFFPASDLHSENFEFFLRENIQEPTTTA